MGRFNEVCWITQCPIREGDRVGIMIVERHDKGRYRVTDADALYRPRTTIGWGKYDSYGWATFDENQPEFETLLKAITGLTSQAESHQIRDALQGLKDQTGAGFRENWKDLEIALFHEKAVKRAVLKCALDDSAIVPLIQTVEQQQQLHEATDQFDSELYHNWAQAKNELIRALFPSFDFPELLVDRLVLDWHSDTPQAKDALKNSQWILKFQEVGAIYDYHRRYLWRPLINSGFALPSTDTQTWHVDYAIERQWLADEAKLHPDSSDTYIGVSFMIDGMPLDIDAYDWVYRDEDQVDHKLKNAVLNPKDAELLFEVLMSDCAIVDSDWHFAQTYVKRFEECEIVGAFNSEEIRDHIQGCRVKLATELGLD